jgi:hypothetical protein
MGKEFRNYLLIKRFWDFRSREKNSIFSLLFNLSPQPSPSTFSGLRIKRPQKTEIAVWKGFWAAAP